MHVIRYFGLLFIAFCIAEAGTLAAGAAPSRIVLRHAGGKIPLVISGKARTYVPLRSGKPVTLLVRGPGELRVITRVQFRPEARDDLDYRILYAVDGGEVQAEKFKGVKRSATATYGDGAMGVPGDAGEFKITLGRGQHSVEISVADSLPRVAARFVFKPKKERKQKWIALAPSAPAEQVDLLAGEETVAYFRFKEEKPLRVEVNGPTELRVLTRVENHYDMKGSVIYRLQVRRDGKVMNTYMLSSKRSETTTYKNNKTLVPGKAREVTVPIPRGRHVIEVIPLDKGKTSLLGHILLPRKDVKLEQ